MDMILTTIGHLAIAALFGAMAFFPSVVAPTVFRTLPEDQAGRFLRGLFPGYYAFLIATSAIGAATLWKLSWIAPGLAAVAASTLAVRQLLVPRINAWRDAHLAGDEAAGRAFALGHRVSVLVNLVQLVFVVAAAVALFSGTV